jgi:hypothetical protein
METTTDHEGYYRFQDLSPGEYTVSPAAEKYVFAPATRAVDLPLAGIARLDFASLVDTARGWLIDPGPPEAL